jgi:adenylate kinase
MPPKRQQPQRQRPNILITGTPGTGKTTTAEQLAERTGFRHINVGQWVKEHELHSGWDEEHDAYVLDDDKVGGPWTPCIAAHDDFSPGRQLCSVALETVMLCSVKVSRQVCDALEEPLAAGGCIVDHHSCDFFPERWFDLVVVLQTNNTALFDRLQKRYVAAVPSECYQLHS